MFTYNYYYFCDPQKTSKKCYFAFQILKFRYNFILNQGYNRMQYLSADITTLQRHCQTPHKQKSTFDTSSSTLHQQLDDFNKNRGFQSEQCPKAHQNTPDGNARLASYNNSSAERQIGEENLQNWPQIKQIVKKICKMQASLANERKINKELSTKLKLYELKMNTYEQQIESYKEELLKNTDRYQTLLQELKRHQDNLILKDQQILKNKETIQDIQMSQLKRISEIEQKLRKSNAENKQFMQKLRRSNIQLQKQRNLNKELKKEMVSKIENMQSSKENYLLKEIENLKEIINSSQDEKQSKYLSQIAELNRKIYHYQEEIKVRNIQISLLERKKQQAVKEICDKKDQEIKVQKTMTKTLNQKLTKIQEDFKKLKKQSTDTSRTGRVHIPPRNQEEFLLELSPQKC